MRRILPAAILLLSFTAMPAWALTDRVEVSSPCVSADGQSVYFSAWGDIWVSDRKASQPARQLTNSVADDDMPLLSPDGKWLAFGSDRYGSWDVLVMPAAGGQPRRLTWSSDAELPCAWSPDGTRIMFSSGVDQTWLPTLWEVDLEGGAPRQLGGEDQLERINGCYAGDSERILLQRGVGDWWRRNYRGSFTYDIYSYERGTHALTRLTEFDGLDAWPQSSPDGKTVYFVSDRQGSRNVYSLPLAGGAEPKRVSDFNGNGPTSLRISSDGDEIACESFGELWLVSTDGSGKQRVPVQIAADPKREWVLETDERSLTDFRVSPNGNYFLAEVDGDLHILKNPDSYKDDEKPDQDLSRTHLVVSDPGWERQFSWHPEGTSFVYVSDRSGQNELYLHDLQSGEERKLTNSKEPEWAPQFAPKGERIAYVRGNTELRVMDLEDGTDELIYRGNLKRNDWVAGFSWAPDGYWLAFCAHQGNLFFDVYLANVETRDPVDISQTPDSALNPVFSRDGKWLAWSQSSQVFDESSAALLRLVPEGNTYNDDLLFPEDRPKEDEKADEPAETEDAEAAADDADDAADAESADDADAGDEAAAEDDDAGDEDEEDEDDGPKYDPIEIDFERIHERYFSVGNQFVQGGAELFDFDSGFLFFSTGGPGGGGLWAYDLDSGEESPVDGGLNAGNLHYGKDGKRLYYNSRGGIGYLEMNGKDKRGQGSVPLTARVRFNQRERWEEVLADAWRQIGYNFYDNHMHGIDWDPILPKYQKRLEGIGTTREFNRLLTEMVGEINASHTWAFVPNLEGSAGPADNTGFLGVDFDSTWPGPGWFVERSLRDGPADDPGHELYHGDVILAIDGHEIQPADNRFELLRNMAGNVVRLRVRSSEAALAAEAEWQALQAADADKDKDKGKGKGKDKAADTAPDYPITADNGERELLLRLSGGEGGLRYRQWVDDRQAEVDRLSKGRIAYVHMPGMNMWQYNNLFREIFGPQKDREALIIDVRFNNGGNIHNELAELFSRRMFATVNPRGGPFSKEPSFTWERPVVMLINERAYSDGEIVPHVFKQLGLATLIGMPTGGNVIRAGGVGLLDGSAIATPADGFYMSTGLNTERNGVEPDIRVEIDPLLLEQGRDSQIEEAVRYLLEQLN
ncbi:PD40 domain-containing protein [bacterium]|nr:PD40 domain-containing protein [bacterium]